MRKRVIAFVSASCAVAGIGVAVAAAPSSSFWSGLDAARFATLFHDAAGWATETFSLPGLAVIGAVGLTMMSRIRRYD